MATPPKCCFCRDPIQPVDGRWVGIVSGQPDCRHAPDGAHARQVVIQPADRSTTCS
jgi:hypothetical protein